MADAPLGVQIARLLRAHGVGTVFGIPGVHNVELYRGLEEAGIAHVLARHEQGAGFMADGYARATGRPGVVLVISGPGLTNLLTPLGQAYSDSVPVLAISSCLEARDAGMGRGRLHEMRDQEGAARTVCAWSKTAWDAASAFDLVGRAFAGFARRRPRPVHIQIPIDVLGDPAPEPRAAQFPARPDPAPDALRAAAAQINAAERPLFVLGGGSAGAARPVRRLVERCRAAVFPTYAGRGVVPGGYGLNFGPGLANPRSADILARADLLVVIGAELAETDLWRAHPGHGCPAIRVDLDPDMLADTRAADLPVLADARAFSEALLPQIEERAASGWAEADADAFRAATRAAADQERPGVAEAVEAMMAALPADATIVTDMTQFAYVGKQICAMEAPGRWHHPNGFGTLGFALPAAIGARLGAGAGPVICVAGDYGFQYTVQELGTAVELGLSLPIVIWDNDGLKEIEATMRRAQMPPRAVTARNPDFLALARAYGAEAAEARGPGELTSALKAALTEPGPVVIRARAPA